MEWVQGGCHCRAVRFRVLLDTRAELVADECNCSMCEMVGFQHIIVPRSRFQLEAGDGELRSYTFLTGVAIHLFCGVCGVKSFYVPRSNPDGYSVNLRCIDRSHLAAVRLRPFDGQNWDAAAPALAHLSLEGHEPNAE
jgi:hypothetical protein